MWLGSAAVSLPWRIYTVLYQLKWVSNITFTILCSSWIVAGPYSASWELLTIRRGLSFTSREWSMINPSFWRGGLQLKISQLKYRKGIFGMSNCLGWCSFYMHRINAKPQSISDKKKVASRADHPCPHQKRPCYLPSIREFLPWFQGQPSVFSLIIWNCWRVASNKKKKQ